MTKMRHVSDKRGFTLIEAFAATAVIAICLLSTGLAIYTQFTFVNQNREKAIATLAAQEEIENIRGMAFGDILNLGSSFTSSGFVYLINPAGTLAIDNPYGPAEMRRVTVTVSWRSGIGQTLSKTLATIVSCNGINKR